MLRRSVPDEERITSLWERACERGAASLGKRSVWVSASQVEWRRPLEVTPQPVHRRHADFAAWFVGE